MPEIESFAPMLFGVAVLVLVTIAVLWASGTPRRFAPSLAIFRGAAQLAAISVVLHGVITSSVRVAVALLIMFTVATVTATRRIRWSWKKIRSGRGRHGCWSAHEPHRHLLDQGDRLHAPVPARARRHRHR